MNALRNLESEVLLSFTASWKWLLAALPFIAVYFGSRQYWLKWGTRLRGTYTMRSSISCEDDYVSRVTLENVKDRAATIFAIYLQIGPNLYVLIEEFGDMPLVLKGFETIQRNYEPIEFYSANMNRLKIDALLKNEKVRKRLVLSTSTGKHVVQQWPRGWKPTHLFFRNHMTGIAQPMRSEFKGKAYGSNAIYVITFKLGDGTEHSVPVYSNDSGNFRDFTLTKESLKSKEALEYFLMEKQEDGVITATSIEVHDLEALRDKAFDRSKIKTFDAPHIGFFTYHVLGRISTILNDRKMRQDNKRAAKKVTKGPNPPI